NDDSAPTPANLRSQARLAERLVDAVTTRPTPALLPMSDQITAMASEGQAQIQMVGMNGTNISVAASENEAEITTTVRLKSMTASMMTSVPIPVGTNGKRLQPIGWFMSFKMLPKTS